MKFRKQRAIYLQIGDYLCENILTGKYVSGDKIPSVRNMAVNVEVNPNTVMRTYTHLQQKGILFNQRGIGFFIADDVIEKILEMKKKEFLMIEAWPVVDKKIIDKFQNKREIERKKLFDEIEAKMKGLDGFIDIFGKCLGCHGCSKVCRSRWLQVRKRWYLDPMP